MTLADIHNAIMVKLDDNHIYYPSHSVVRDGINPAMRLLAMVRAPLRRRVATTVNADTITIDLRQVAPRFWRMKRVVLGTITGDAPTASNNEYRDLPLATIEQLALRQDWFMQRGTVSRYWRFGGQWLGIYKRPLLPTTITLIFDAMPLAFTAYDLNTSPSAEPELVDVVHPLIADVAFALLLVKEGVTETDKAEQILQQTFGAEMTKGIRRALYMQRGAAA